MWSTKMVIEHVKKRYGYRYAARSMYDLLHRIRFSIKQHKSPTTNQPQNQRENNSKKARRAIKRYTEQGYTALCLDEATHVIAPNVKRGWYL